MSTQPHPIVLAFGEPEAISPPLLKSGESLHLQLDYSGDGSASADTVADTVSGFVSGMNTSTKSKVQYGQDYVLTAAFSESTNSYTDEASQAMSEADDAVGALVALALITGITVLGCLGIAAWAERDRRRASGG